MTKRRWALPSPAPEGPPNVRRHGVLYALILALTGLLVAQAVVGPFQAETFVRADGATVRLPAPRRLNHTSDTFDYLQIARQAARGCGYTSLFTYPPFLPESAPFLKPDLRLYPSADPTVVDCPSSFPVLWRQPGYPLLISTAFVLRGDSDPGVLEWIQGLAIVLLPLVTYLLALRFLSPEWAALAGLWTVLSPLAVSATSPFGATTWFAVVLTLLVAMLFTVRRTIGLMVVGMVLGVCVLFRLETWMLLPGLLVMYWMGRTGRRGLGLAWILVPAVLTVTPWYLYLWVITGNPFYNASSLLYHATAAFPGWESSRTLAVRDLTPWEFLSAHPGDVVRKTVLDLARYGRDLLFLPSPLLAPFLWLALLRLPVERAPRAFLLGGAVAGTVLIFVLAPLEYAPRFLGGLVPLAAVGAAWGVARMGRYRLLVAGAATVVGGVLLTTTLTGREQRGTALVAAQDLNRLLATRAGASILAVDTVVLADAPTIYAWIWDRPAVWLPVPQDVPAVRALLPVDAAVLITRAAGTGDDLAPDTIRRYLESGGVASSADPPLFLFWPAPRGRDHPAPGARP